jgi:hypothetical protein
VQRCANRVVTLVWWRLPRSLPVSYRADVPRAVRPDHLKPINCQGTNPDIERSQYGYSSVTLINACAACANPMMIGSSFPYRTLTVWLACPFTCRTAARTAEVLSSP